MLSRDHCKIKYSKLMKELETIEKKYLPILPSKLTKQYTKLQEEQQSFKEDAIFNAAARMVRFLHVRHLKLIDALEKSNPTGSFPTQAIFEHTPLMIPSKMPGKVYVFSNLIVDTVDRTSLRNICWIICFDSLESFNKIRATKPNSWRPFFRGWQKIKSYEELSLMRALTRYTNISAVFSHEHIQALEAAYLESIAPLELVYADDRPKDYVAMFAQGGVSSCMTTSKEKKEAWKGILEQNHHPMSLFAYHPYIKGVYSVKSNKVVARTLLYKDSANKWLYGRIFAVNRIYSTKFENTLLEAGYSSLKQTFARKVVINVPGIYVKDLDDYLLPVPYMDNVQNSIYGEFDSKTKQFTVCFKHEGKKYNLNTSSTGGYVRASSLLVVRCDSCYDVCRGRHTSWDGRHHFCSPSCASSAGYVYALTAEGQSQLRVSRDCYYDFFERSCVFTNKHSCKMNGGARVIHDFTIKNHKVTAIRVYPEEFSVEGIFVRCVGKKYIVRHSTYTFLTKERLIESNYRVICSAKGVVEGVTV